MAADHFFKRWARPGNQVSEPPAADAPRPPAAPPVPPTLADVTQLASDADYSRFLAAGVDPAVQRAALKKLFSDPHFNLIDGLDIFMGDYTQPSPLPAAMLAALCHAQGLLAAPAAPAATEPAPPAAPSAASQPDAQS